MRRDDAQVISKILSAGACDDYRVLFERYAVAVEEVVARAWEIEVAEQAELVEESFVHAFANLARLREPSRFAAYLLGIAHGLTLRHRALCLGEAERFSEKPNFDVSSLPSPGTHAEVERRLGETLGALAPEVREVAEASYFGAQVRPQILAAERGLEVARVGALLLQAWLRFKASLIGLAIESQRRGGGERGRDSSRAPAAAEVHLQDAIYEEILHAAPLPAAADALARHLGGGECAACEGYLSRRSSADAFDGLLCAALFAREVRGRRNPAMFQRIVRRLKLDARLGGDCQGAQRIFSVPRSRLPLTLAAALGLAGIALFALRGSPSFQASLGAPTQRALEVAFYLVAAQGEDDAREVPVTEGVSGQPAPASSQLILTYGLRRASFVAITRALPDRSLELRALPARRPPGHHVLSMNGVPARLLLRDAVGRNRFAVIASERPFGATELKSILPSLLADADEPPEPGDARLPPGMALSWFDLDVLAAPAASAAAP